MLLIATRDSTIASLCADAGIEHTSGCGYYSLSRAEKVSQAKDMIAQHQITKERVSGGKDVREKFGLGSGDIQIGPSSIPADWSIFIQSTSSNRKIPTGSSILVPSATVAALSASAPRAPPSTFSSSVSSSSSSSSSSPSSSSSSSSLSSSSLIVTASSSLLSTPSMTSSKKVASSSPAAIPQVSGKRPSQTLVSAQCKQAKHGAAEWFTAGDGVSLRDFGSTPSARIVGFDMDWTLIRTKSGKTFATSKDDWELWSPAVSGKLLSLHAAGYKIAVFTNQLGISKGKEVLSNIQEKIDALQSLLGVPMIAAIMFSDNLFRKPRVGAWELIEANLNGAVAVDRALSLFVGDGAGREASGSRKKDFGNSDLTFALNLGVRFETPEECFLGQTQHYSKTFDFDPRLLGLGSPAPMPCSPLVGGQEVVVVVGAPGSGKSSLHRNVFRDYARVNRDTLKTSEKCIQACSQALASGKSVVVDNQNACKSDRAPYLAAALKAGVPCRAVIVDVPKELCFHLNEYRSLNTASAEHRGDARVPDMVIHSFFKKVERPSNKEGFTEVLTCTLAHFSLVGCSAEDRKLINSFL